MIKQFYRFILDATYIIIIWNIKMAANVLALIRELIQESNTLTKYIKGKTP